MLALVLAAVLAFGSAAGAEARWREIDLSFVTGEHSRLDSDLAPIRQGPLTIKVRSPEHLLVVHESLLAYRARDGEGVDLRLAVDFEGQGKLIADLEAVGAGTRFEDRVAAPRQRVEAQGAASVETVPGGWEITLIEAPPSVELRVESGVADQIVGACEGFSKLPLFSFDCEPIARGLSNISVSLPEPGEVFYVKAEPMSRRERKFFNAMAKASRR